MNRVSKRIVFAALTLGAALGVCSATLGTAEADKRFTCQMVGTWVETNDDFKFQAAYIAKDGPDTFTGRYSNPGTAEADIIGNAANGIWTIILTYTDAGHKGMSKKLIGRGARDAATNLLKVEGDYKTYLSANDIKKDGRFKLQGKCK